MNPIDDDRFEEQVGRGLSRYPTVAFAVLHWLRFPSDRPKQFSTSIASWEKQEADVLLTCFRQYQNTFFAEDEHIYLVSYPSGRPAAG